MYSVVEIFKLSVVFFIIGDVSSKMLSPTGTSTESRSQGSSYHVASVTDPARRIDEPMESK